MSAKADVSAQPHAPGLDEQQSDTSVWKRWVPLLFPFLGLAWALVTFWVGEWVHHIEEYFLTPSMPLLSFPVGVTYDILYYHHLSLLVWVLANCVAFWIAGQVFWRETQLRSYAEHLAQQLRHQQLAMVRTLSTVIDARDFYSKGHSERVVVLATAVGRAMGLSQTQMETLALAAEFHDFGKVFIRDTLLLKPGPLDTIEFAEMMTHPRRGTSMLYRIDFLRHTFPIIEHHHERWDGRGYPDGLQGESIPLEARILAVVDSYEAMASDRPYRKSMSHEDALEVLRSGVGSQWDPTVVEQFLAVVGVPQVFEQRLQHAKGQY